MTGLTQYGFERDNRTETLEKVYEQFRAHFGTDINLAEDSVYGKFAAIFSEFLLTYGRIAEETYESRKITSAEGVWLDDILNRFGFFRRGAIASGGTVTVQMDSTTLETQQLSIGDTFNASNNKTYSPIKTFILFDNIEGCLIKGEELSPDDYQFNLKYDEFTGTNTINLPSVDPADIKTFLDALAAWIVQNTDETAATTFVKDYQEGGVDKHDLYVGWASDTLFKGMSNAGRFSMSPRVGTWFSAVDVEANTEGYAPLKAGGIGSLNPAFTGYISSANIDTFYEGAEAETDAEFLQRYNDKKTEVAPAGTTEGVLSAVNSVDGVKYVTILENTTSSVDANGVAPFTFKTLVYGSYDPQEVAEAIYNNKAITDGTDGDDSYTVVGSDGQSRTIKFSEIGTFAINLRITYKTDGSTLTIEEQSTIKDSLIDYIRDVVIGDTIYNLSLVGCVLDNLPDDRIKTLIVEMDIGDGSGYSTDDYKVGSDSYSATSVPSLVPNQINFVLGA